MTTHTTLLNLAKSEATDLYQTTRTDNNGNADILEAQIKKSAVSTLAPTTGDDSGYGYSIGSIWVRTVGPVVYVCTDASVGAAYWRQVWPIPSAYVTNAMLAGSISDANLATPYIKADGSRGLSAAWDAGSWQIRAETFQSDVATGTAPLTVASTTLVANLRAANADNSAALGGVADTGYVKKTDFTAKGSIQVASGANTPANFAAGTEGQGIIVQAAAGQGLAWDSSRLNGWVAAPAMTYAATDAPSYTVTITGDYSAIIMAGMRVMLTDSTVKYFIVTKSTYSAPNTTLTLYGGTDYTLSGGAISLPFYSMVKAPAGFPLDPLKWTVSLSDTSDRSQATPTASTWYNLGSLSITIPIGSWVVNCKALLYATRAASGDLSELFTLSTANNSESDSNFTSKVYLIGTAVLSNIFVQKGILVSAKTVYYLNASEADPNCTSIHFLGTQVPTKITASCAYL